jgi:hypothetical protein
LNNKTTPSALFYNKFSQPFFTDIPDFVADYNKLILEFQIAVMKLIVKYLEMRVSLIKSKLIAIKQNLAMNNFLITLYYKIINILKIIKASVFLL